MRAYFIEHCEFHEDYSVFVQRKGCAPTPWIHVKTVWRGEELIQSHVSTLWKNFTASSMWPEWASPTTRLAVNVCYLVEDEQL